MDDVLIAGGGPAGALAAIVLARGGARVRVFDRARFPRDKLCGDTVNPGALRVLSRLGVAGVAGAGLPVRGMIVTGEPDVRVEVRYGGDVVGRALTRRAFDAALLDAAAAAGAQVEDGVLVRGPLVAGAAGAPRVHGLELAGSGGRSRSVSARIVIGADGRPSRIARALGLASSPARPRRWAVGTYFDGIRGLTSCGEMHVRAGCYIGIAPLRDGVTNVCLVTGDRTSLRRPADLLIARIGADRQLAGRFTGARMIGAPVVIGPLAVDCAAAGVPGLLLAGDAAGFIDPMTGDGLRFALRGAELAAAEALRALERGPADAHRRLLAARRREFAAKWRFNRTLRAMVDAPLALRTAARGAALAPVWLRRAVLYAGDVRAA